MYSTVKEYKQKFGTLKRIQQTEKKKNAHLLEEARRREEDISTDSLQLKVCLSTRCRWVFRDLVWRFTVFIRL